MNTYRYIKYSFLLLSLCLLLPACEEDQPKVFVGEPYLTFPMDDNGYSIYVQQHYSNFYYLNDQSVLRDTIYVPLVTMGSFSVSDIPVKLEVFDSEDETYPERIDNTSVNAEAGVHYLPFDSDEMGNLLTFRADRLQDSIPVIILRDPSMQDSTFRLTFRLAPMDNAQVADKDENRVVIYLSDRVSRPSNWDYWYFRDYGDVKLDFMIRHSDLKWDEKDMEMVLGDSFLLSYYLYKFREELIKENEALGDAAPLREKDGTVVAF